MSDDGVYQHSRVQTAFGKGWIVVPYCIKRTKMHIDFRMFVFDGSASGKIKRILNKCRRGLSPLQLLVRPLPLR